MKKKVTYVAALSSVCAMWLLALPTLAWASEEAAEESASGIGLLLPKLGEWIPMLIGFIILWVVLAKFGWPAFMAMIDKRQATIKDQLEKAETAKVDAERLLEQTKAELDEAKKTAAQIISDAKVSANNVRAEITAAAQSESENMLAKARAAIETEKKAAIAELQGSLANLTVSVAGRVIGSDLSDKDHRQIIERYLAEAGSFNDN